MTKSELNAAIAAWSAELGDDISNLADRKAAYEQAKANLAASMGSENLEVIVPAHDTFSQVAPEYFASLESVNAKFKSIVDNATAAMLAE